MKSDSTKTSDTTETTVAPKVRARRLSTSLRAGAITGGTDPGGGGSAPDGGAPSADGGVDGRPPIDGCYITYGSLNTWGCRG